MATAVTCFIIVATAYFGVMTIGSIIWGITMLIDYLEVEKMFRKSKATVISPPKPKLPPVPKQPTNLEYKIFTKDDYKRYILSTTEGCLITKEYMKAIDKVFIRISKGYNFVIGTGQGDTLMFFSPEYFNEEVLGGK